MTQVYSDPSRESDPHALPDVEVFYVPNWQQGTKPKPGERPTDEGAGWYWWACFPGCMPDSDPFGPFTTEDEAIADAQEGGEGDRSMEEIDEVLKNVLYEIVMGMQHPEEAIELVKQRLDNAGYEIRPKVNCVFEARDEDGKANPMVSDARAWCQAHGFDCPTLRATNTNTETNSNNVIGSMSRI